MDEVIGTCTVCGQPVTLLIRVGGYLFTEPCAHRVLDLQQFDWFQRYQRKHQKSKKD